jgi:hypothetical protein
MGKKITIDEDDLKEEIENLRADLKKWQDSFNIASANVQRISGAIIAKEELLNHVAKKDTKDPQEKASTSRKRPSKAKRT